MGLWIGILRGIRVLFRHTWPEDYVHFDTQVAMSPILLDALASWGDMVRILTSMKWWVGNEEMRVFYCPNYQVRLVLRLGKAGNMGY